MKDIVTLSREGLHEKRIELATLIRTGALPGEGSIFEGTIPSLGRTRYSRLLEDLVCLDLALKKGNWENADEIADTIISGMAGYPFDERCAKIMHCLLEEYNV